MELQENNTISDIPRILHELKDTEQRNNLIINNDLKK
jgi:hypothetical protein